MKIVQVFLVICPRTFIEVSGFEEEETHEEVAPLHYIQPPVNLILTAEPHDVQCHHSDDADAAQNIKGMISFWFTHYSLNLSLDGL